MNRELIYSLLRVSLSEDKAISLNTFCNRGADAWESVYRFMSLHGVASLVFQGVEQLPQDLRPQGRVLMNFIGANMAAKKSYVKLHDLVGKIEGVLRQEGIKCLLLKGLSLAEYYPSPELRRFLDVDLYAPGFASKIDDVFAAKGVKVDSDFYRHSHMSLAGVLVENHHCLLDVRGRKLMAELDADLKTMALAHLETFDGPGLYYPDARFSLIFNLHHAMSHFIYEGISFKFLVDWIYFLKKEKELLTTDQIATSLRKHGLMKFAAVMTEVSVRHLGLAIEDVPECIRIEIASLKPAVVERFVDDLFRPYENVHKKNILAERFGSVRRIVKSAWKPKEFLGQNAWGFVISKAWGILMGKTVEAD